MSQMKLVKPQGRRGSAKTISPSVSRSKKVRTGCRTCKVRRLKCDESRPACMRCTTTGRLCDGYGPLAIASLPFDIPGTDEERRSYHYFRLQTATVLLGAQDAPYWTTSLLQLSYAQPAIRHALIAIASIHEALVVTGWYLNANDNDQGRKLRLFSWRQYNEAIYNVLRDTTANRMPIEVLIVLCLLFNQYDNLLCDYIAAFIHIKSGLSLVQQWSNITSKSSDSPNNATDAATDLIKDHLTPMLVRLNVQATFLRHSGVHSRPYHKPSQTSAPEIPLNFASFSEARQLFDYTASYMFHVLGIQPEDCDQEGKKLVESKFEQWVEAFDGLVVRSPVRSGSDNDRAARLLRIYYNFARVVLECHHNPDEMGFDTQTERFRIMVEQAQGLAEVPHQKRDHPGQQFSFDIPLASALNFVAARCRVPHLRRQAIAVLKNATKSSWNCEHCALVEQHILNTEEEGLGLVRYCSQIPKEKRIRRIYSDISFKDAHIKLTYIRYPYTADMPINLAIIPLRDGFSAMPITDTVVEISQMLKPEPRSSMSSEETLFESPSADDCFELN